MMRVLIQCLNLNTTKWFLFGHSSLLLLFYPSSFSLVQKVKKISSRTKEFRRQFGDLTTATTQFFLKGVALPPSS